MRHLFCPKGVSIQFNVLLRALEALGSQMKVIL